MTHDCVTMTASAFTSKYNDYANSTGDSYSQYPYQVRFYHDEIYNRSTLSPQTNNHVAFRMPLLKTVFTNVFQTLAYVDGSGNYVYITDSQATTAFNAAMTSNGVTSSTVLDLSDATQRAKIFSLLESAINNLATNLKINFSAVTLTQLGGTSGGGGSGGGTTTPKCPTNPVVYPTGFGTYKGGDIVKASDGKLYQCISNQVAAWCNNAVNGPYSPTGWASSSAWNVYTCTN